MDSAEADEPAFMYDGNVVGDALRFVKVVCRQDDGTAFASQLVHQFAHELRTAGSSALVGSSSSRTRGLWTKGSRERDFLLVAFGEGSRSRIAFVGELQPLE